MPRRMDFLRMGWRDRMGFSVNLEAQFLTWSMSDLMFPFCDSESHFTYFKIVQHTWRGQAFPWCRNSAHPVISLWLSYVSVLSTLWLGVGGPTQSCVEGFLVLSIFSTCSHIRIHVHIWIHALFFTSPFPRYACSLGPSGEVAWSHHLYHHYCVHSATDTCCPSNLPSILTLRYSTYNASLSDPDTWKLG